VLSTACSPLSRLAWPPRASANGPPVSFAGRLPAPAAGTLGISPIFNRYRLGSSMLAEEFAAPPPRVWDIVSRRRLRVGA
jgi:hypothetical protein